jgi:hypothetical protein
MSSNRSTKNTKRTKAKASSSNATNGIPRGNQTSEFRGKPRMSSYEVLISEGNKLLSKFSEIKTFRVTFTRDGLQYLEVQVGDDWLPGDQFKIEKAKNDPIVQGTGLRESQITERISKRLGESKQFNQLNAEERRKVLMSAKLFRKGNKGPSSSSEKSPASTSTPATQTGGSE